MSITALVKNYINLTGDLENELVFSSGDLVDSLYMQELATLAIGANTVTLPSATDFTLHGLAIVPPSANANEITLKGVSGDTGITLSATQVSVVQFGATPPASIVLTVAAEIVGVRLIWF